LADSITARLLPESESELSNAVEVLDPNSWPQEVAVEHGEVELRLLCDRFLVPVSEVKHEFRDYEDSKRKRKLGDRLSLNGLLIVPIHFLWAQLVASEDSVKLMPSAVLIEHV